MIFIAILIIFIKSFIFGYVAQSIIENKGYQDDWFCWGFFFGLIAVLIALAKPDLNLSRHLNADNVSLLGNSSDSDNKLEKYWTCVECTRRNAPYVGTCACGFTKAANTARLVSKKEQGESITRASSRLEAEYSVIDALTKYKALLDNGTITQEEYDLKKKSLLS